MEKQRTKNSDKNPYLTVILFTLKCLWKLLGFFITGLPANQNTKTSYDRRMEMAKLDPTLIDPHPPKKDN